MKERLNRLKENLWKNKYIVLAFSVVWIALIIFSLNTYRTSMGLEAIGTNVSDHVTELCQGVTVEQELPVLDDARSISIRFATYARRNNKGNVRITVKGNESGTVYADTQTPASDFEDNLFLTVGLDTPLDILKDDDITITLSSDSIRGQGVGVYYTDRDTLEGGSMHINGMPMSDSDITVKLQVPNSYYEHFSKVIIIWSIAVFSVLILMIALEVGPQIRFAMTALLVGMIFIAIITPMSVPDEQFHYEAAYQIVSKLLGEDHTIIDKTYRNYSHFNGHENSALAYFRLIDQFDEPLELKGKYEGVSEDIDNLSCLDYFFPQTVGVFIGRVLKLNFLKTFYLGRFTNLLFYAFCVYWAIRIAPTHKNLIGVLCCMPMFLQQCSSYSYDCMINGLIFILLAYFLKWYMSKEKIPYSEIAAVSAVVYLLAPTKFIYGLFIVPFYFVPADRFDGRRNKLLVSLVISLPVIYNFVYMLAPQITRMINRIEETYGDSASAVKIQMAGLPIHSDPRQLFKEFDPTGIPDDTYTVGFIVEYPVHTVVMVLKTIRFGLKRWFYDALGRTLSGETLLLPIRIIHILTAVLVLSAFTRQENTLSPLLRIIMIGICVVIGLLILLGFLLSETSKIDELIQGVQGRYFSPLLSYFFVIFANKKFSLPKGTERYLSYIQLLMLFEVILYILSFTFVNY